MSNAILYLDDERSNLEVFEANFFLDFDIHSAITVIEAERILAENEIKVVITDQRMPTETGLEFIKRISPQYPDIVFMVLTAFSDFKIAQQAVSNSSIYRYLLKPWKEEELKLDIGNAIDKYDSNVLIKQLLNDLKQQNNELTKLKKQLEEENALLKQEIRSHKSFGNIVTINKQFRSQLDGLEKVANTDASVLINGETGTGKELIARAIHDLSARKDKPFVSINCAAIPESLFESELFGHEKGAFTSAVGQRKGKLEIANGGTVFLDEIGEMPIELQAKLLRAIQQREIERLGGNNTIKLDFRIVSATNKDLKNAIKDNEFRSDLYFRLNVIPFELPPLRERAEDIPTLVKHFVNKFNPSQGNKIKNVPARVISDLQSYDWPGNIRELENVIERAVIISDGPKLSLQNCFFLPEIKNQGTSLKMEDVERQHILAVLERTSWKIAGDGGAAELIGLNRSTLISRMNKLGIKRPS